MAACAGAAAVHSGGCCCLAILAIPSNQGSRLGGEHFAERHRHPPEERLGTAAARPPQESSAPLTELRQHLASRAICDDNPPPKSLLKTLPSQH